MADAEEAAQPRARGDRATQDGDGARQTIEARLLVHPDCELGEGVTWRDDLGRLFFTDILGRRLLSCDADGGALEERALPERLGCFAFDRAGAMICGFESGIFRFDPVGDRLDRLTRFEPDQPSTRLNDGRCDRQGRFLAGGVDEAGLAPISSLMRYADGRAETLVTRIGCSNGLAFSPDGARMYHADSAGKDIFVYDYDPQTGALGARRVFATLTDAEGAPDGAAVAADGGVWNAEFGAGAVQEHRPCGARGRRVLVDAPQTTCCCFGGPGLDRLFITTARENMSADQVAAAPLSGALFAADVGAVGLPEPRYREPLF